MQKLKTTLSYSPGSPDYKLRLTQIFTWFCQKMSNVFLLRYINLQKRYNLVRWIIYVSCCYPYTFKIQQLALALVIGLRPNFTIADCSASADCIVCSFGHCLYHRRSHCPKLNMIEDK